MEVVKTGLEGLLLIKPKAFGDARGYFFESYQAARYHEMGVACHFVQDNLSRSQRGVLRGLHFQYQHPQDKLVTVSRGEVFDVAVDIRRGSPTFGKGYGVVLSDTNHWQLFVPKGFAHGFYVMSETADFHYKCSDYYHPECEMGIIWNDPSLGLDWPFDRAHSPPALSAKDQAYGTLAELAVHRLPDFTP